MSLLGGFGDPAKTEKIHGVIRAKQHKIIGLHSGVFPSLHPFELSIRRRPRCSEASCHRGLMEKGGSGSGPEREEKEMDKGRGNRKGREKGKN